MVWLGAALFWLATALRPQNWIVLVRVSAVEGAEIDEGFEVFGCPEGVHFVLAVLAGAEAASPSTAHVVEMLERVGREVGLPATTRVDQGTDFVSRDVDLWAYQRGVTKPSR